MVRVRDRAAPAQPVQAAAPVPVAAASGVAGLLTGATLAGTVLAVFRSALLIAVRTPDQPRVVALLANAASGSPNGVRLPASGPADPFAGLRPGQEAAIGGGDLTLGGRRYRLARVWRSEVPAITVGPAAAARVAAAAQHAGLHADVLSPLAAALGAADDGRAVGSAAHAFVGLGPGLTPAGDDVLAGLLIALRATGQEHACDAIARAVLSALPERTTVLSADLLRLAAAGHVGLEVLAVLRATHADRAEHLDNARDLDRALAGLLAVGGTSGADLAAGLAIGLARAVAIPSAAAMPVAMPVAIPSPTRSAAA